MYELSLIQADCWLLSTNLIVGSVQQQMPQGQQIRTAQYFPVAGPSNATDFMPYQQQLYKHHRQIILLLYMEPMKVLRGYLYNHTAQWQWPKQIQVLSLIHLYYQVSTILVHVHVGVTYCSYFTAWTTRQPNWISSFKLCFYNNRTTRI